MEIDAPALDAPGDDPSASLRAEPTAVAPAVVAVVLAHDPGTWFEDCLRSLGDQDYPSLSVLVIDAGSADPVTSRVAAVLPEAYVRRIEENPGVAAATNEVLGIVEGAAFFLLCHDDVAFEPGAVRALVEEAYRSNAGIVGPKLVAWDDTRRLLQVGMLVDKTGHEIPAVERGELDQEQHDAVRDVFCVPGAATLVRADLFASLGGYDPSVTYLGEDLDLCWRAQVVGARVLVAPSAVVRHLEALGLRPGFAPEVRRRLAIRHRIHAVLTCYDRWHRARVLPQMWALTVIEVAYALVAGRRQLAADLVDAWRWNRRNRAAVVAARARVAASRSVPDAEIRRLQTRGIARLAALLRGQLGRGGDDRVRSLTRSAGDVAGSLRRGPLRTAAIVWGAIVLTVVVGSRHFLWSTPPALVDLQQFPVRPWPVLAEWLSGWRRSGLGGDGFQPTAYGLLGVGGSALLGSMMLLRRLLVVVPLLLGPLGAARLAAGTGSRRAALVAAVAYAAVPAPYDALANGRWGGVLVWAATPWIVARIARAGGDTPFDAAATTATVASGSWWRPLLALGLLTAVLSAFQPLALLLPLVVALALALGGLVAGHPAGGGRGVATAVGAAVVALVLHLPWALELTLPGTTWASVAGAPSAAPAPSVAELLRFETGPVGAAPLGWLPLVAAALPLAIGRSWRFSWAVRGWALALVGWALAIVAGSEAVDVGTGPVEALLAPAAAGLALAAALGMSAFESDLRGYRFGWRQIASALAGTALALATVPVLGAALGGRWDAPSRGAVDVLTFLDTEPEEVGPFRTLWLGDPAVLPVGGWRLQDGVAWSLTGVGIPTALDRWVASTDAATELAADALDLATSGQTSRLGRLLAPMGVRYVIVVEADRPVARERTPVPSEVPGSIGEQLDMVELEVDASLRVFRNEAWFPSVATVPSLDVLAAPDGYLRAAARTDLADDADAPLEQRDAFRYEGTLPDDAAVWFAAASASGWDLEVGGRTASRVDGFDWGTGFAVEAGGDATLSYSTPVPRLVLAGLQAVLWVLAAWLLVLTRRGRTKEQA